MKETFKVYVSRKDDVEKSLVKLSKKAAKYHIPFSWEWGAISDWERGGNMNDYGEQDFLDALLVRIGCPDLATFTKY